MFMKTKLITALASIFTFLLFTACSSDPDHLYGKDKEMKILDEYGDATTYARASILSGTTLTIVGGIGEDHIIEVQDEDILGVSYSSRGVVYDGPIKRKTYPAELNIRPKKYGSTVISITDPDLDKTIHVDVKVVDHYAAMTVLESTAEGIEEDMLLAFKYSDDNEYRIISQEGKEYDTFEFGEYHFEHPIEVNPCQVVYLTLKSGETETIWEITDGDNNKDGHKLYINNIFIGMGLPSDITTKLSYTEYYPTEFLFTDTSNPERKFKTTAANTAIKYTF